MDKDTVIAVVNAVSAISDDLDFDLVIRSEPEAIYVDIGDGEEPGDEPGDPPVDPYKPNTRIIEVTPYLGSAGSPAGYRKNVRRIMPEVLLHPRQRAPTSGPKSTFHLVRVTSLSQASRIRWRSRRIGARWSAQLAVRRGRSASVTFRSLWRFLAVPERSVRDPRYGGSPSW